MNFFADGKKVKDDVFLTSPENSENISITNLVLLIFGLKHKITIQNNAKLKILNLRYACTKVECFFWNSLQNVCRL